MASRRFLITGGSQGIGAAIVEAARAAGDPVVFTGREDELIGQVAEATGAIGLKADVSLAADNARTVEVACERMGGVDVLVNNAAFGYFAKIGELDVDAMRTMFETNVFGLVDLTNRVVPLLIEQGGGDIVNISSTSGLQGHVAGTPYAGGKWALRGITQSWQAELRPHDVRVLCVFPDKVKTAWWRGTEGLYSPPRLLPSDIAQAVMAALAADRRAFWPELTVLPTNPWKEEEG